MIFKLLTKGRKGDVVEPKRVRIVLGNHFLDEHNRYLTTECVTASELKSQVNYLKHELDKLLKKGSLKFRK
jgi:hypothetical protein